MTELVEQLVLAFARRTIYLMATTRGVLTPNEARAVGFARKIITTAPREHFDRSRFIGAAP